MLSTLLLAALPIAQLPAPQPVDQLELEFVLTPDGPRYYRTYVPADTPPDVELPMVVCYHGGGGNALQIAGSNGILEQAQRRGWMAVFPEGTGILGGPPLFKLQTWNVETCCGYAFDNQVDDIQFFERMLAKISTEHPLDESRVFLTGMSNGGMMSYRIAVERPDLVTAIAPVAAALTTHPPASPVPLLAIHGLLDTNVPFGGGDGTGVAGVPFPSQAESILPFLAVNGLGGPVQVTSTSTYLFLQWEGSPLGAPTWVFLALDGAHTWPGSVPSSLPAMQQPMHTDVPASPLIFEFFEYAVG